jgi:hypothetical protein
MEKDKKKKTHIPSPILSAIETPPIDLIASTDRKPCIFLHKPRLKHAIEKRFDTFHANPTF